MLLAVFYLFLSGCLVIPTSATPPLNREKIEKIQINVTNKQAITNIFGEPDVIRDNESIWIYSKVKDTSIVVMIYPPGGFTTQDYEWLFLRFDKNKNLIEKEFIEDEDGCTKSGYCLHEGWVRTRDGYRLFNHKTILLVPKQNQILRDLEQGHCRYFLYDIGKMNWKGVFLYWPINSVNINDHGPFVLDKDTFTYVDLPEGNVVFSPGEGQEDARIDYGSHAAEFDCQDGQTKYLGISKTDKDGFFKSTSDKSESSGVKKYINIFEIDPVIAKEEIKKRKLVVNP